MKRFNHMFDVAFSLESEKEDASDVTTAMLLEALIHRIASLHSTDDAAEAFGLCDTYEVKDVQN